MRIAKQDIVALAVVLLFLAVNLYYLRDAPLPGDTSPYISNAFHTQKFDYVPAFPNRHPGLASSFWQEFMLLFKFDRILQFRLLYAVLFLMPMLAVYLLGSERDKTIGLVALLLFAANPISIYNMSAFENQAFSTILLLVAVYCFYYAWERDRGFLPLAAFLAAAAAYNREDGFFLPLVMGTYLIFREGNLRWLKLKTVLLSIFVYAVTILPLILVQYGLKSVGWGIFVVTKRLVMQADTSIFYYFLTLPDSVTYGGVVFLFIGFYLMLKTRENWRVFMFSWFLVYIGILSAIPYKTLSYGAPFTPALLLIISDGLVQTAKYLKKRLSAGWIAPLFLLLFIAAYGWSTYYFFKHDETPNWYWPNAYTTNGEMEEIAGSVGLCPHLVLMGAVTEIEYFLPTQSVGFGWVSNDPAEEIKAWNPQLIIIPKYFNDSYSKYLKDYPIFKQTEKYRVYKLLPYDCRYRYDPYSKFVIGSMTSGDSTYPVVWQWPEVLPWYTGRLTPHLVRVFVVEDGKAVELTSANPDNIAYAPNEVRYGYGLAELDVKSDEKDGTIHAYLLPRKKLEAARILIGKQVVEYGALQAGEITEVGKVKPVWNG